MRSRLFLTSRRDLRLVRHRINDRVGQKFEGISGIDRGVQSVIGPLESIAKIRVPGHEYVNPATLIEYGEDLRYLPGWAILPLLAFRTFGDGIIRHLNDFVDVVKAVKQRMGGVEFHRRCPGQHSPDLPEKLSEFLIAVKVVGKP